MSLIEYHLFRIKFVAGIQLGLFPAKASPSDIFREAILAKPSLNTYGNIIWHIGNIESFNAVSGCFAVGRTTKTTLAKFDPEKKNFTEEAFEASPYTFCVYNLEIGIVAIAKKSKLASTTSGIASKVSLLLSTTESVQINNVYVLVDPISDPVDFLRKIDNAIAVMKFKAWFTGPNPFDADELFQKPLSVYCKHVEGRSGSVEVEGEALNKQVVKDVARSTAATGNDASARIHLPGKRKAEGIRLSGDPIKKTYAAEKHDKRVVAEDMVSEYRRVRNP